MTRIGAYGLHLPDLAETPGSLVHAPSDWPTWRIVVECVDQDRLAALREPHQTLGWDSIRCTTASAGWMTVDRRSTTTIISSTAPVPSDAVVHPLLAVTAAAHALWSGGVALHAAGLVVGEACWGILGHHGSGKSSTVAAWNAAGRQVACDDVLAVHDETVLAGPRAADLRPEAAAQHPDAVPVGRFGTRERWRLTLPQTQPEMPLAGFVVLEWGEAVEMAEMPRRERLEILSSNMTLRLPPRDLMLMPALSGLPMFRLRRPRTLESLPSVTQRLSELG